MGGHRPGIDQQRFIATLQRALAAPAAERGSARHNHIYHAQEPLAPRSREAQLVLLDEMIAESVPINLKVVAHREIASVARDIGTLVVAKEPEWGREKRIAAWRHPLIDALDLPAVLEGVAVAVDVIAVNGPGEQDAMRQKVSEAYVGITAADFCLADSATLVMKSRAGQDRSVSLVPSIHIAVIRLDQILANLKELYYLLVNDPAHREEGLTPCMTFISGPSKTADIEATMVHGAHGPREVHLFVVTG